MNAGVKERKRLERSGEETTVKSSNSDDEEKGTCVCPYGSTAGSATATADPSNSALLPKGDVHFNSPGPTSTTVKHLRGLRSVQKYHGCQQRNALNQVEHVKLTGTVRTYSYVASDLQGPVARHGHPHID
ncbi:hypothetical protein PM082_010936 [Marasmius tenuissimus]|nr:hypothetical protein PM082_010936 [Marasmius tenuissimus]